MLHTRTTSHAELLQKIEPCTVYVTIADAPEQLDWELPADASATVPAPKAVQPPPAAPPAERPTTSRRVANPAVTEFFDYVVPSPSKAPEPHNAVQSLVLDQPAVPAQPAFRANRPAALEGAAIDDEVQPALDSNSGVCCAM